MWSCCSDLVQKMFLVKRFGAGQELFDTVISPCCAEFYDFGSQNSKRGLERTHRGNQRTLFNLFIYFAHLPPIFSSGDFLKGSYIDVKNK